MWIMPSTSLLTLLSILFGSALVSGGNILDVIVGQEVVIKCKYSQINSTATSRLYWIRNNKAGHDNVAIGKTPFDSGYTVNHLASEGKYDLRIEKADYDRDNGKFLCQMKQAGSGTKLHSSEVQLVVLLPPEEPVIHPTTPTFTEGSVANLTCSSRGGSPPPQIYWYRGDSSSRLESLYVEGTTKDEATTALLSINPKKEDDGSKYRCRVWNRAMEKEELEAVTSINVNYFPRVTIGPVNPVRVEKDGTAELFCKVDAKPAVNSVRWLREGRFIAQTLKHVIPRVSLKDAGPYVCSADNNLGQNGSAEAQLDVLYGPQVHLPLRKETDEGDDILVFCNVTANPRASSFVWTKEDDEDFVQNGPTLLLPGSNQAAVNNGRYICSATNVIHPTGGEKEVRKSNATITVLVRHAPGIAAITPDDPIGVEGEAVRLECGADPPGYPEPTYMWWREGKKSVVISSAKQMIIHLSSLKDMGRYLCQPSNKFGKGTVAETVLDIYQKPKIILPLENMVVKKTGDRGLTVKCEAVAKPKPQVTWYKNGLEIDSSISNLYQVSVSEKQLNNNKTFQVTSILKFLGPDRESTDKLITSDRGLYSCQFKNEISAEDTKMMLRIEHAPIVKHVFNKVAANLGKTASISCRIQAYPSPQFEWFKQNSNFPKYNMDVNDLGDDIYEGVLRINRVRKSSYGEYTCNATNIIGTQQTVIEMEEKGKPDKPKNVMASEKSPFSVSLAWDEGFNGGYEDTTFNIDYKKVDGGSVNHFDCGRRFPCIITGLEQFTTYQFKVQSVNIRGASQWTRDISVTTDVDVSQIPKPKEVYFATTSNIAEFEIDSYSLKLFAEIEIKNGNETWRLHSPVSVGTSHGSYKQVNIDGHVSELRVRFCLDIDKNLCGAFGLAKTVEELSLKDHPLGQPWMIASFVLAGLATSVLICILIICCRSSKPNKLNKKDMKEPALEPSHSYDFVDSAGMIAANETQDSPIMTKSQYGYNQPQDQQFYDDYTNSSTLPKHMQQYPYEGYFQGGNTLQKQQISHQYRYGYDDFSQHPHLDEEYMNGQKNAYFTNGDRYALPIKSGQTQELAYNPYGDDTGVPDHYSVQNISEGLGSNQELSSHTAMSLHSNAGMSMLSNAGMSFHSNAGVSFTSNPGVSLHNGSSFLDGVPPPEGYSTVNSTPSRRIIREIIV